MKRKNSLLSENLLLKNEHEPVFITWNITIKTIKEKSSFASDLLNICSYFHCDDIPHFLLKPFAENVVINPNNEIFEDACGLLFNYSMIKVNKNKHTISLHRVLQEVMRLQIENENDSKFFLQALIMVLQEYPDGHSVEDC